MCCSWAEDGLLATILILKRFERRSGFGIVRTNIQSPIGVEDVNDRVNSLDIMCCNDINVSCTRGKHMVSKDYRT